MFTHGNLSEKKNKPSIDQPVNVVNNVAKAIAPRIF